MDRLPLGGLDGSESDSESGRTNSPRTSYFPKLENRGFDLEEATGEFRFTMSEALRPSVCNAMDEPAPKQFFRLFIADTGASFDVVKEGRLLVSERRHVRVPPSPPPPQPDGGPHGFGELRFNRVANALIPALREAIEPFVTPGSPILLSVGFRCELLLLVAAFLVQPGLH